MNDRLSVSPDAYLNYIIDDFTEPWRTASTVVFVHGFAESSASWTQWLPYFLHDHRVVRYDQRGFGHSTPMPRDYPWSLDELADDLVKVIEAASATKAHIVAAKIGGPVAIRAARRRPDLFSTLTLVGTPVVGPRPDAWIKQIEAEGPLAWARTTMDSRMGSDMPEVAKTWWIDLSGATAASTMLGFLGAAPSIDVREDLKMLSCPCLVLTTDSQRHPVAEVEGWCRTIPDARLVLVPGDGYHAAATDPAFCASRTLEFVENHDTRF